MYHTIPPSRFKVSKTTIPTPQKHPYNAFLRVANNLYDICGVIIQGAYSLNKVSTLSFLKATEEGRVVWDTPYVFIIIIII